MSCPDCFAGHVHEGNPKGRIEKIQGLDTYIAEPPGGPNDTKGIIVIVPDAFGMPFVNNRILADHLAEKGHYTVYLPDFMKGSSAPPYMADMVHKLFNGSIFFKPYYLFWVLWAGIPFSRANAPAKTIGTVRTFFKDLRAGEASNLPVGAAGYCWGARHICTLARNEEDDRYNDLPPFEAGFCAHPSYLVVPDDINALNLPISFAIGDKDIQIKAHQIPEVKKIVEEKEGDKQGEVKTYVGAGHGFAVRADHILSDASRQAAEAEDQCIAWFQKCFAKNPRFAGN